MSSELVFVFEMPECEDPLILACDIIGEGGYTDSLVSSHPLGNVAITFDLSEDNARDPTNLAHILLDLFPKGTVLRGIGAPSVSILKQAWP